MATERETVRRLVPSDEPLLDAFFTRHPHTTLFLQGNRRLAGIEDRGERFQGVWAGAFRDGALASVAVHFWNGVVMPACPEALDEVVDAAVGGSGREVSGVIGPAEQVEAVRHHLGLDRERARLESSEDLFVLPLSALRTPASLAAGALRCRLAREDELPLLADWRGAYSLEILGAREGPELRRRCREDVADLITRGCQWVVEAGGIPLACSAFNADLPHCVQVGGVYTPPAERGRGHARAVVAGSLQAARTRGVRDAVLFTGRDNRAARRVYRSLGFEPRLAWTLFLL